MAAHHRAASEARPWSPAYGATLYGRQINRLRESGMLSNTFVVFVIDVGSALLTFAQVAIGLAGFSAILVALSGKPHQWTPVDAFRGPSMDGVTIGAGATQTKRRPKAALS